MPFVMVAAQPREDLRKHEYACGMIHDCWLRCGVHLRGGLHIACGQTVQYLTYFGRMPFFTITSYNTDLHLTIQLF